MSVQGAAQSIVPNLLRRIVGGALILLVVAPFWKLLSSLDAPIALEAITLTDRYAVFLAQGTIAVIAVAAVIAYFLEPDMLEGVLGRVASALESLSTVRYAIVLAAVSGVLTALLSAYVWEARPLLVDVLAQFVHARYFADGLLAAPAGMPYEFWVSTNTFVTEQGWVSQYPPGHMALLAIGFVSNAVWVVCPVLMAVAVFFTCLTADRLFHRDRIIGRVGALLFALSPYLLALAGAHMSHVTVVAFLSAAAYLALRAKDDHWTWAIPAGICVGCAFATRSVSALVLGPVLLGGVWLLQIADRERRIRFLLTRIVVSFAGALPLLLAVAFYNAHFFGSPFEFGYTAYLGPNHGLGFHPDPFGNYFGPREGLAYTSSDLVSLGYFLLRTPVSAVLLAGLFLIFAKRLSGAERLATAWALCLVVPMGAYWHHDLVLGPRMLSDSAPGWCLLVTAAGFGLVRQIPKGRTLLAGQFSPRFFVTSALVLSLLVGAAYFAPRDIRNYARTFAATPAPPRPDIPMLVFVHGTWEGRIVARLLAEGMRADSVNVALSLNSTCTMDEFAKAYSTADNRGELVGSFGVRFTAGAGSAAEATRLPNGVVVRTNPNEELTDACLTEAQSDRGGAVPLLPLLWQGDLPGLPAEGAMYVRDLGPVDNASLVARYPRRPMGVLLRRPDDGRAVILPYQEAMELLWRPEETETGGG